MVAVIGSDPSNVESPTHGGAIPGLSRRLDNMDNGFVVSPSIRSATELLSMVARDGFVQ